MVWKAIVTYSVNRAKYYDIYPSYKSITVPDE